MIFFASLAYMYTEVNVWLYVYTDRYYRVCVRVCLEMHGNK